MKYLCGNCIHFDVCYVPRSIGCVEICGHFREEPKEPMTNEEYLRTANVDDMATMIATKLLELARHEYGMCDVVDREIVLEWLKQPHTIKE